MTGGPFASSTLFDCTVSTNSCPPSCYTEGRELLVGDDVAKVAYDAALRSEGNNRDVPLEACEDAIGALWPIASKQT